MVAAYILPYFCPLCIDTRLQEDTSPPCLPMPSLFQDLDRFRVCVRCRGCLRMRDDIYLLPSLPAATLREIGEASV